MHEAQRIWRNMRLNHEDMEKTVLALLRHPDATPEQLDQVRKMYLDSYERMLSAQNAMLQKFGNYGVQLFNPPPQRKEPLTIHKAQLKPGDAFTLNRTGERYVMTAQLGRWGEELYASIDDTGKEPINLSAQCEITLIDKEK